MKGTPWSRISGQDSADKEFLEIVGNVKPTGSVPKETIAVSVTISISVQKWHSRIRLRVLSCNRMREMRREPDVPEEKVPEVERFDCLARNYLKGSCTNSFCEKSRRMDADLGKSALMRIAKLTNSQAKGPKRMMTKVQWPC